MRPHLGSLLFCCAVGVAAAWTAPVAGCGGACQDGTEECRCVLEELCDVGLQCIGGLCVSPGAYDSYTSESGTGSEEETTEGVENDTTSPDDDGNPDADPYGDPALGCLPDWYPINVLGDADTVLGSFCTRDCVFDSDCQADVSTSYECFYDPTQTSGLCVLTCEVDAPFPENCPGEMFCTEVGVCAFGT